VIWVAIGGRGSLYGAVLGAILVNYGKTYFTGALPEAWLYMLGALFVAVTLFFPKGIVGSVPVFGKAGQGRDAAKRWLNAKSATSEAGGG